MRGGSAEGGGREACIYLVCLSFFFVCVMCVCVCCCESSSVDRVCDADKVEGPQELDGLSVGVKGGEDLSLFDSGLKSGRERERGDDAWHVYIDTLFFSYAVVTLHLIMKHER